MRFTSKTEYALICLVNMAHHPKFQPVTSKEIVKQERYSLTFTEKILQRLRSANIVLSHQGSQGGYVLSRDPSEINLREIVEAMEGHTFDVFCAPKIRKQIVCTHFPLCSLKPVWEKTKDLLDEYYASISLEMLAGHEVHSPSGSAKTTQG